MAVRIGPLPLYEQMVYGYAMPQGHQEEMTDFYHRHEQAVQAYFKDRPDKLLRICWEDGERERQRLADFLDVQVTELESRHVNVSPKRVYEGDSLPIAHLNRIAYQQIYGPRSIPRRAAGRLRRVLTPNRPITSK